MMAAENSCLLSGTKAIKDNCLVDTAISKRLEQCSAMLTRVVQHENT